jgi:hypothetical protein
LYKLLHGCTFVLCGTKMNHFCWILIQNFHKILGFNYIFEVYAANLFTKVFVVWRRVRRQLPHTWNIFCNLYLALTILVWRGKFLCCLAARFSILFKCQDRRTLLFGKQNMFCCICILCITLWENRIAALFCKFWVKRLLILLKMCTYLHFSRCTSIFAL